jgi:hypothetical protein
LACEVPHPIEIHARPVERDGSHARVRSTSTPDGVWRSKMTWLSCAKATAFAMRGVMPCGASAATSASRSVSPPTTVASMSFVKRATPREITAMPPMIMPGRADASSAVATARSARSMAPAASRECFFRGALTYAAVP